MNEPLGTTGVKFVLYSHFSFEEDGDHKNFKKEGTVANSKGLAMLKEHLSGLREVLTSPGYAGILVLFYACGLHKFMEAVKDRVEPQEYENYPKDTEGKLKFAGAMSRAVNELLRDEGLETRIRFITPLDLGVIFSLVNVPDAERILHFVLGKEVGIRYDTPKIPEAILRLRLLGSGVPVFRVDQDVLFREDKSEKFDELSLFKAIACSVLAYELRLRDPSVSSFGFSASYDTRALRGQKEADNSFEAWGWAFATRVHPALTVNEVDIATISEIYESPKGERSEKWKEYAKTHLDEDLVCQYYGLRSKSQLEVDDIRGITAIGAHPFFAVISGAFLCLSEGAIVDLPPFSNFRENVMWIDDHLKYSLHREMHHFTSGEKLDLPAGLEYARLDKVMVTKARPTIDGLVGYIFASYLPTLLWGAIVDSWIVQEPILKLRRDSLAVSKQQEWNTARETGVAQGVLPKALLKALQEGRLPDDDATALRAALWNVAIARVEEVRQLWGHLRRGNSRTFASYWACGEVTELFPEIWPHWDPKKHKPELYKGIAPGRKLEEAIQKRADLGDLLGPIDDLITDAIDYIKWTLLWPKFVQIVRSVRQGSFRGDMSWMALNSVGGTSKFAPLASTPSGPNPSQPSISDSDKSSTCVVLRPTRHGMDGH